MLRVQVTADPVRLERKLLRLGTILKAAFGRPENLSLASGLPYRAFEPGAVSHAGVLRDANGKLEARVRSLQDEVEADRRSAAIVGYGNRGIVVDLERAEGPSRAEDRRQSTAVRQGKRVIDRVGGEYLLLEDAALQDHITVDPAGCRRPVRCTVHCHVCAVQRKDLAPCRSDFETKRSTVSRGIWI